MPESTFSDRLEQTDYTTPEACLELDADGEIRASNSPAAELLGGDRQELRGRPITALIPALPVRRNTTGYNVAYVGLWHANGARRQLQGVRHDGRALPLDIALSVLKAEKSISYLVQRRPAEAETDPGRWMIRPFADSLGNHTHFVALGTDAGERVEAAQRDVLGPLPCLSLVNA